MSVIEIELKAALEAQKSALKLQTEENERLRKALCVLLSHNNADTANGFGLIQNMEDYNEATSLQRDSSSSPNDDSEEADVDNNELPEPIHGDDNLHYCTKCTGEIEEGFCVFCGEEHEWVIDDSIQDSVTTISQSMHPDRSMEPRGDTPLREIHTTEWEVPPVEYRSPDREDEYWELIRRGATPLMCQTFHLEFSYERGIYAWADEELFCQFSGSLMKPGHFWKIHLGRRIVLDADDLDGSEFVEGLLEEGLYYPQRGAFNLKKRERWETVEESPGLWVTRLQALPESEDSEGFELDNYHAFEEKMLENPPPTETVMRPDEYSVSDDDSEIGSETEDIGFFNPEGRDTIWTPERRRVDELVGDDYHPDNAEGTGGAVDAVMEDDASLDDSDEAGSDFDSDEVLSGDEQCILRR